MMSAIEMRDGMGSRVEPGGQPMKTNLKWNTSARVRRAVTILVITDETSLFVFVTRTGCPIIQRTRSLMHES